MKKHRFSTTKLENCITKFVLTLTVRQQEEFQIFHLLDGSTSVDLGAQRVGIFATNLIGVAGFYPYA